MNELTTSFMNVLRCKINQRAEYSRTTREAALAAFIKENTESIRRCGASPCPACDALRSDLEGFRLLLNKEPP